MASGSSPREFAPVRTENILNDQDHQDQDQTFVVVGEHSYKADEIEQPQRFPSDSATDIDERDLYLSRTQTSKSNRERREREFSPINAGDRVELHRIATSLGGSIALARTKTGASSRLERQDTLAGVNIGDPVLDPASPEFDTYKWLRM